MIIPRSNLPPGSQVWASKMEQLTRETDSTIKASESQLGALSKGQEATIGLLSEQINTLNTQLTSLPLVQMYSINAENNPGFVGSGESNYYTAYTTTYTFPEGKTTADVMIYGDVSLDGFTTGANYYYVRVGVNGSYDASSMIGRYTGAGVAIARAVSGPSFTVSLQASASAGASVNNIDVWLTVMVSFK
jgi:hypothetical protein